MDTRSKKAPSAGFLDLQMRQELCDTELPCPIAALVAQAAPGEAESGFEKPRTASSRTGATGANASSNPVAPREPHSTPRGSTAHGTARSACCQRCCENAEAQRLRSRERGSAQFGSGLRGVKHHRPLLASLSSEVAPHA